MYKHSSAGFAALLSGLDLLKMLQPNRPMLPARRRRRKAAKNEPNIAEGRWGKQYILKGIRP